jgi:NTE family protein
MGDGVAGDSDWPNPRDEWTGPRRGIALALSGGGYRATLFGLGSLWRLNDLGWLPKLRRITSVSGGSIAAGLLAARWHDLEFNASGTATNFTQKVADPLRVFCSQTMDWQAAIVGLLPFLSAAKVASAIYKNRLLAQGGKSISLGELPGEAKGPDFIFYATCLQTGSSFRFSRDGLYDWRLGQLRQPDLDLSIAIAASAAFPPFLSPFRLKTDAAKWQRKPTIPSLADSGDFIRSNLELGDGGVYDNMATEAAWKTAERVLVSDAGAPFVFSPRLRRNWYSQLTQVRNILIQQTRALRKRMLMTDLQQQRYGGAYWGISTKIANYKLEDPMCSDTLITSNLEQIETRLMRLKGDVQEQLINWGYCLADAAIRCHIDCAVSRGSWPYSLNAF